MLNNNSIITLKTLVHRIANQLKFEIKRLPSIEYDSAYSEYQTVIPSATYSPWNTNVLFKETYESIKEFTLVDKYRCFELWNIVEQTSKLSNGDIIEIGVWRGGTGALIAKQAENCKIPCQVYLCDTFTGVVKAGPKDSTYQGGEHSDTSRKLVEEFLFKQMRLKNIQILEGIFPDHTKNNLENLRFRVCHIDVDVYQSAKDIGDWIWPRMVKGGVIIYDDYGFKGCDGITKYVEEQMFCKDRLILHNLNGHAVIIKL